MKRIPESQFMTKFNISKHSNTSLSLYCALFLIMGEHGASQSSGFITLSKISLLFTFIFVLFGSRLTVCSTS